MGFVRAIVLLFLFAPTVFASSVVPESAEKFISTNFENKFWQWQGWNGAGLSPYVLNVPNPLYIKRTDDPAGGSNTVLDWPINKGMHSMGRLFSKSIDTREAWAEFKIYIPESVGNYDIGSHQGECNKLPGFTGGGSGSLDHGPGDGEHGWSARIGWKVNLQNVFQIGYYTYDMNRPTTAGEWQPWEISLNRNRWYTITEHIKVNSLGASGANPDGVLEAWVDGQLVFSKTDIKFTSIPEYSVVKAFWLNAYFGGSETAPHDMEFYFDDINVYRAP